MVLSGQTIRELKILSPFREKYKVNEISGGLSVCSYDVALDQDILLQEQSWQLASTQECFTMPLNVCAVVHDKSTWARLGISVLNTFIDPGWNGYLTLELFNHDTATRHRLQKGTPIAQIVFMFLDKESEKSYNGKYQNQQKGITKPII